jgi:hypothetical protein
MSDLAPQGDGSTKHWRGRPYPRDREEPEHVTGSLLSGVASLWQARAELRRLKAKYKNPAQMPHRPINNTP